MNSATPELDSSAASSLAVPKSRVVWFVALATLGAVADLATKSAIFQWRGLPGMNDPWWIIDGVLGIETAVNIGAVFGIGAGKGLFFAAFSIVAAIGILVWLFVYRAAQSLWLTVALGMITGGIIGNLYDRLGMWWLDGYPPQWQSGVRDWILFRIEGFPGLDPWPNFNIADSLLVVGAGMLMYQSFFPGQLDSPQPDSNGKNDKQPAESKNAEAKHDHVAKS
ncbi:signal peptidase II [Rubripirellula lacrimiformis]|nr:signal peptidase II [Rubripirellula lacrimiformis]